MLALELPVPGGHTAAEFWSSVHDHGDHYLAFLISFYAIAASWGQHHRIYRAVERTDPRLRSINMSWLLMIVLNPLATKMLTTEGDDTLTAHALRFGFYALLQVLAGVALLAASHHLSTHQLRADGARSPLAGGGWDHLYGVITGFGLSIPVFFVTSYGWVLWFAAPLLIGRVYFPLLQRQRAREQRPQDV
nr:TMEM175 family protein [Streptomyces sp. SID4948]